jgi:hypothetical protein
MFWLGFFSVMLASAFDMISTDLGPKFEWARSLRFLNAEQSDGDAIRRIPLLNPTYAAIRQCCILMLATLAGFIGVYIYDHRSPQE